METRKTIVYILNSICLLAFLVWLIHAISNYQSLATSSKISFKHGDDGDKMVRFPSVSICQSGEYDNAGNVWNDVETCNGLSTDPPYFLSYLEHCLESNVNTTLPELIQNVSFRYIDLVKIIYTFPSNKTPLGYGGRQNYTKNYGSDWTESPIIHSQYHYHYGHCFTVDIAALSENQGKYKMKYGWHKMALTLLIKGEFENHYRWKHTLVFIHNGTNINQFGESIKGRPVYSGNTYDVSLSGINFKMY